MNVDLHRIHRGEPTAVDDVGDRLGCHHSVFEWMTTSAGPMVEMKGLVNGFLNPMANYHSANE